MWTGGKSNKSTSVALPFSVLCHPSLTVTFCATSLASVFGMLNPLSNDDILPLIKKLATLHTILLCVFHVLSLRFNEVGKKKNFLQVL